ncbi:MAG TPA: hypothetical protein ENH29_07475 [Bacteroidetes bacterium]|nr:hypothetical protein [Bacteroidota bacterium]
MNISLQDQYQNHRQQLFKLISALSDLLPEGKLKDRIPVIKTALQKEKFRLVVLGQFKRGKSTFINALLGAQVLPTDVIPVTAVITEILFGSTPAATLYFCEGEPRTIAIDDLNRYITESENPANKKNVDKVEIRYPAPILKKGLILVDTPGVGSIHEHNSRLTQEYIPQVDVAIFLFSADPPLTELEKKFLQTISPLVPYIEFVLNKKDYLSTDNLNRVLRFNQQVLEAVLGIEPEISAISALRGLKAKLAAKTEQNSGLPQLQKKLDELLLRKRGKYLLISNTDRLLRITSEWKNLIEMEQKAKLLGVEQLQDNLKKFNRFIAEIRRNSDHLKFLLEGLKTRLLESFDKETAEFAKMKTPEMLNKIGHFVENEDGFSKRKLMQQVEKKTNHLIVDQFEPFRLLIEKDIREEYTREIQAINGDVNRIVKEIYRFSADLFQIARMKETEEEIWQYKSRFYYKTWDAMTGLDLLENTFMTFLPRKIFLFLQKRHVKKVTPEKLERQFGRLRADLLYRLQDNNRQYLFEFQRMIERIQDEITRLIQKHVRLKEAGETELHQSEEEQERLLQKAEQLIREMSEIKNFWTQV